jgi:hypothetical protein
MLRVAKGHDLMPLVSIRLLLKIVTGLAIGAVDSACVWRNSACRACTTRHSGWLGSNEAGFAIHTFECAGCRVPPCVALATARHVVMWSEMATGAGGTLVGTLAVAPRPARGRVQTASCVGTAFAVKARSSANRRIKALYEEYRMIIKQQKA